jgi:monoamine oxidase
MSSSDSDDRSKKNKQDISRRGMIKMAAAGAAVGLSSSFPMELAHFRIGAQETASRTTAARAKNVVVIGAGIGGLCCAFELMDRGHDVTVLEASGRAGGHVKTIRDPLPDGLYADVGAEHFTKPGYDQFWKYVERFHLPALAYPRRQNMLRRIDGKWYAEDQLQDRTVLSAFGFNPREIDFIAQNGWTELPLLYLGPYLDAFSDEYQPFAAGLDQLDEISAGELFAKDGASDAAMRFNGVRRGDGSPAARNGEVSALFRVWQQAIVKRRGLPVFKREVFRLKGGNQLLTDAFAANLGERLRFGCPVTAINQGSNDVSVQFKEFGVEKQLNAEYVVCCIPLAILKKIPVTPAWPESKQFVLDNVLFGSQSRVLLQSRTPFWKGDLPSINLETGDGAMYLVYETADEVPGDRSLLMGSGRADVTSDEAMAAFQNFYPGKSHTLEQAYVHNWSKDPWAFGCERYPFALGSLKKFWPHITEPVGRIHFAGSFADNLPWGMDAATRSANRVAETIHQL